jgi:hypothetical protein
MNRTFKSSLLGIAAGSIIILILFLAFSQVATAEMSVPILPMTVKGVALINGTPAPDNTVIVAYLNGQPVDQFLVSTSSGEYCLWISGTSEDEGKPITFTVDGMKAGSSIAWESGKQVLCHELSVGKGVDSGSSLKAITSRINSYHFKGTESLEASGNKTKSTVIEGSVPEPNVKTLKNKNANSGDNETAKYDGSSQLKSASGFDLIYAILGITLLTFGANLKEKSRRKH